MSLANRLIYAEGQVIAFEGQFFDADFRPIPNANPGTKRTKRQMDGIRVGGRDLVAHLRQRRFRQPSSYNAVSEPPTGIARSYARENDTNPFARRARITADHWRSPKIHS